MSEKITYKDAGVDIELADSVISSVAGKIKSTFRPEVIGKMGGFAAMFRPDMGKYRNPVLVSATDGVGTKLKIAFMTGIHNTVGIDLVAMNVNDLLVTGAEPLFFLDYFATGKIEPTTAQAVISGIAEGCIQAGCALIGGETAEMPDFYAAGEYDLAGFCVGMVDQEASIDGSKIRPGDAVIGIASSGLHSNGFSLVRKIFLNVKKYKLENRVAELGRTLGEELLAPTTIYVKPVLDLMKVVEIKGMAHITGGGFTGNIPRILPDDTAVMIRKGSWDELPIFGLIRFEANLDDSEMYRTFNMGIGLVLVISSEHTQKALDFLAQKGLKSSLIGAVVASEGPGSVTLE